MEFLAKLALFTCLGRVVIGSAIAVKPEPALSVRDSYAFGDLRSLLSPGASVSTDVPPRWSAYHAPAPRAVINVATERDVEAVVQYCLKKNVPFLAQGGGHGWIKDFHLGSHGITVNLRGLNSTVFNADRTQARVGGGAITGEVIAAAYAHDAQVMTAACDCIGFLGVGLGGGYGALMGEHGFAVDNMLELNVVLANGSAVTVRPADRDLWFALRGAGPNFGVVTSALVAAYPTPRAQSTGWIGQLFYTPDQLEALIAALDQLKLGPKMNFFMSFANAGPTTYSPVIFVIPFYHGATADAKKAFAPLYVVGPVNDTTAQVPYDHWNAGASAACTKTGRKPLHGAGFQRLVPATWRRVWDDYTAFLQRNNGTGLSQVLLEAYSLDTAQALGGAAGPAFPWRDVRFHAIAEPWYDDASLDGAAVAWAAGTRDLLRATSGLLKNETYINFAFGDEPNRVVYGENTAKLQALKRQYDPKNVFSHWFDLGSQSVSGISE